MAKQIKTAIVAAVVVITGMYLAKGIGTLLKIKDLAGLTFAAIKKRAIYAFAGTLVAGAFGQLTNKGVNASMDNFGRKVAVLSLIHI